MSRRGSVEVPDWVVEIVRRCKDGNVLACEIAREYRDLLKQRYLNYEKSIVNGTLLTVILTSIGITLQLLSRLGIVIVVLIVPAVTYVIAVLRSYRKKERYLETLYKMFLDSVMEDRSLTYAVIATLIVCIVTLLLVVFLT